MAAHSKLTDHRRRAILEAIRAGADMRGAAGAAGVGTRTLYEWREKYPDLAEAMDAAEGKLVAELTSVVVNAASGRVADVRRALGREGHAPLGKLGRRVAAGDPDLALKLLSARYPDTWGRRRVELTGADGGPVQTEAVEYRDRLRSRLDELAARRARRAAGPPAPAG